MGDEFESSGIARYMPALTNPTLRSLAKEVCQNLRRKQTNAEGLLWQRLRNRGFYSLKFYRQHPLFINCFEKETFFVADFFCFERRMVVEVDGKLHPIKRTRALRRAGGFTYSH